MRHRGVRLDKHSLDFCKIHHSGTQMIVFQPHGAPGEARTSAPRTFPGDYRADDKAGRPGKRTLMSLVL